MLHEVTSCTMTIKPFVPLTVYALFLQIFRDGDLKSPLEYNGPREAAGIVSFLKKQAGPAYFTLSDASAVKDFVKLEGDKDVVGVQRQPHMIQRSYQTAILQIELLQVGYCKDFS